MLKKLYTLLLLFIFIQPSFSQELGFDPYRDLQSAPTLSLNGRQGEVNVTDIKGSPFLNDEFDRGYVYDTNKDLKSELFLRYDIFNDVIELLPGRNATTIMKLKRTTNFEYSINGEKFVLIQAPSVINKNQYVTGNGYVSEIKSFDDELVLYKRYMKEYRPGKKAETMYDQDKPASLKNDFFYILKDGNNYIELEPHKRRIVDAFPNNVQGNIKRFIKSNRYKFRGEDKEVEEEIVDIIDFYSSL